jgi:hypothetical protein
VTLQTNSQTGKQTSNQQTKQTKQTQQTNKQNKQTKQTLETRTTTGHNKQTKHKTTTNQQETRRRRNLQKQTAYGVFLCWFLPRTDVAVPLERLPDGVDAPRRHQPQPLRLPQRQERAYQLGER